MSRPPAQDGGQPHPKSEDGSPEDVREKREATPMVTASTPLNCLSRSALRSLLADERDAHRRQRELVRASLVACPGRAPRKA
jgi:hypothetical protein